MSVEMMLYLSSISGSLKVFSGFFTVVLVAIAIPVLVDNGFKQPKSELFTALKYSIVLFTLLAAFLPSEKTCNMIALARFSKEIISGSPMPEKILRLLNKKLDEELKDSKHE